LMFPVKQISNLILWIGTR